MNDKKTVLAHINEDTLPVLEVKKRDAEALTRIAEEGVKLEKLKRAILERNENLLRSETSAAWRVALFIFRYECFKQALLLSRTC